MRSRRGSSGEWLLGAALLVGVVVGALALFLPEPGQKPDDPWAGLPKVGEHTDHSHLMDGLFTDGPSVTRACLECHLDEARQVMATPHWQWQGEPVLVPGHAEPVAIGKRNLINNFCIGVRSNWYGCTSCHAGYGWIDDSFDFDNAENVDCLSCHDRSGLYAKTKGGLPAPGSDLLAAARSVGRPTRRDCGGCHFRGGGGDAVKHGDLDKDLTHPSGEIDVHMGRYDLECVDCHRTENHVIRGRALSVSVDDENQVACTDCHSKRPHGDQRLDNHTAAVACETCHIPRVAIREATKTHWDWSQAGNDEDDDPHSYLKIKGRFVYERGLVPEYYWFNGRAAGRYLAGDRLDPSVPTVLNPPAGGIEDPKAKIWPFKVHRGKQLYDVDFEYLLQPKLVGPGGYWEMFDWDRAARLGAAESGLAYSGKYGFASTEMYWPLAHMVTDSDRALQCRDCHGDGGRLDWQRLGYSGDPLLWGGRAAEGLVGAEVAAR